MGELERLSEDELIDLYYADAARVSTQGYVPYGWQFKDEDVFMPVETRSGINCFAILSRENECRFAVRQVPLDSRFVFEQLEEISLKLRKITVVVLDNASIHRAKLIKARRSVWEQRGLFLFYLPRYSPHLNIVETLWRKLKYEWLAPADYETDERLFYTVRQALAAVGTILRINFSKSSLA